MLQDNRNFLFHGFKSDFHVIIQGQIHTDIISKETHLNIILSNTFTSSLSFLI